jgi:hypothetical protein
MDKMAQRRKTCTCKEIYPPVRFAVTDETLPKSSRFHSATNCSGNTKNHHSMTCRRTDKLYRWVAGQQNGRIAAFFAFPERSNREQTQPLHLNPQACYRTGYGWRDGRAPAGSNDLCCVIPRYIKTHGGFIPNHGERYRYGETISSDSEEWAHVTDRPQHTENVAGFWMQRTEVTNAQYAKCVDEEGCTAPDNDFWLEAEWAEHPVANVSWEQANSYAQWIGGRLSTEAEWEEACQGPEGYEYPWGDEAPTPAVSNFYEHVGSTVAVGSYPEDASPYSLLDMSGNVWEWTSSLRQPYRYDAEDGREDALAEGARIGRGGSFYVLESPFI